jgi:peptidoglycan biosynthesis protein MviN/MurJ (putative lipid II flippase)
MSPTQVLLGLLPRTIEGRLRRLDPHHKSIARGILIVGTFVFLGKLAGAAKEMAVAWRYGVSDVVDAYLFVFNLSQWPVNVFGGILSVVLIPFAARLRREHPDNFWNFRAEITTATLLVGGVIGSLFFVAIPWLVTQPWIGLVPTQIAYARPMALGLSLSVPLGILAQLLSTWTMAANRHINTFLEAGPAIAILCGVLIFGGSAPLIWGTVVGFAIQALLLWILLRNKGEIERPALSFHSMHWKAFMAGFGVMAIGQVLTTTTNLVDQFFAAHMEQGAIAILGYSNRILSLILALGATAIARSTLPIFSSLPSHLSREVTMIAWKWAQIMFIMGVILLVMGWIFSQNIIYLIFQRGEFSEENTKIVSEIFRYSLIQIPFYFSSIVLMYGILSQNRYKFAASLGGINLITKIISSYFLSSLYGLKGLMISSSFVYICSCIIITLILFKETRSNAGGNTSNIQ